MKKIFFAVAITLLVSLQMGCNKDNCAKPCQNGGTCNGTACDCPDGYLGLYCEQLVDTCAWLDCGTHGTCVTNVAEPYCACDPGYTGTHCDQTWVHAIIGTYTTFATCPRADQYEVNVLDNFHGTDFIIQNFENAKASYDDGTGTGNVIQVPVKLLCVMLDPQVFMIEPQTFDFSDPDYLFTISGGGAI